VTTGALRLPGRRCRGQVAFAEAFLVHELFRPRSEMASLAGAFLIDFSLVVAGLAGFPGRCGLSLVRGMVERDGLLLRGCGYSRNDEGFRRFTGRHSFLFRGLFLFTGDRKSNTYYNEEKWKVLFHDLSPGGMIVIM
jgi:hypothetical protein